MLRGKPSGIKVLECMYSLDDEHEHEHNVKMRK